MDLRTMMSRHASGPLVRLDHFGEELIHRSAAGDRTVACVVNRLDLEPLAPGVQRVARLTAIVTIPRDADLGVPTIAPGDILVLPLRLGGPAVEARVKRIVTQDEAATEVEVGAA